MTNEPTSKSVTAEEMFPIIGKSIFERAETFRNECLEKGLKVAEREETLGEHSGVSMMLHLVYKETKSCLN